MNQQKAFIDALIDQLEPNIIAGNINIGISTFGTAGALHLALTNNIVNIRSAISSIPINQGNTNIIEGLCYGFTELQVNGRIDVDKQILLITDGTQNSSDNVCSGLGQMDSIGVRSYAATIRNAGIKLSLVVNGTPLERSSVIDSYVIGNFTNNPISSNGIYFEADFYDMQNLVDSVTAELYGNEVIYNQ